MILRDGVAVRGVTTVGALWISAAIGTTTARSTFDSIFEGQRRSTSTASIGEDERGRERWLLVKKRDEHAQPGDDPLSSRPESVLSGRTLEQVAAEDA